MVVPLPVLAMDRWSRSAYTERMTQHTVEQDWVQLLGDRDAAYAQMRRLVPQLAAGAVVPAQLSPRQRQAVRTFEDLDAVIRNARRA